MSIPRGVRGETYRGDTNGDGWAGGDNSPAGSRPPGGALGEGCALRGVLPRGVCSGDCMVLGVVERIMTRGDGRVVAPPPAPLGRVVWLSVREKGACIPIARALSGPPGSWLLSSSEDELGPRVSKLSFFDNGCCSLPTLLRDSRGTEGGPPAGYRFAKDCTAAAETRCERGAGEYKGISRISQAAPSRNMATAK